VVGEEQNSQMLLNLPASDVQSCGDKNAKTLALKDMQLPNVAARSGPPGGANIAHYGTDELPVQQDSIPERESTPVQQITQHS
jgi:hypothetical protein